MQAELPSLERLNLSHYNLTDAGLSPLGGLRAMTHLTLMCTKVSTIGLAYVQALI